jgi:hypothetical protein
MRLDKQQFEKSRAAVDRRDKPVAPRKQNQLIS